MKVGFAVPKIDIKSIDTRDARPRLGKLKGKKVLPDFRTAALAVLRGYNGGSYSSPLEGEARELGYHPLSTATPEELKKIEKMLVSSMKDSEDE
jgi:hypothetical protein